MEIKHYRVDWVQGWYIVRAYSVEDVEASAREDRHIVECSVRVATSTEVSDYVRRMGVAIPMSYPREM